MRVCMGLVLPVFVNMGFVEFEKCPLGFCWNPMFTTTHSFLAQRTVSACISSIRCLTRILTQSAAPPLSVHFTPTFEFFFSPLPLPPGLGDDVPVFLRHEGTLRRFHIPKGSVVIGGRFCV